MSVHTTIRLGTDLLENSYFEADSLSRIYLGTNLLYNNIADFAITETLENVSAVGTHPTSIEQGGSLALQYAANTNYELPDSVAVAGATSNWNRLTGTLSISNPTAAVTIKITGVALSKTIPEAPYTLKAAPSLTATHASFPFKTNFITGDSITVDATGITYNLEGSYGSTKVYDAATKTWAKAEYQNVRPTEDAKVSEAFYAWWEANIMAKLATPQNVAVTDSEASWNEVENAAQYEIVVDNASWGTYTPAVYDYTFDESTGVLTLLDAPYEQNGDTVTITDDSTIYSSVTLSKVSAGGQTQGGSYVKTGYARISNADKSKYYIIVIRPVNDFPYYSVSAYLYWDASLSAWKTTDTYYLGVYTKNAGETIDFCILHAGYKGAFDKWADTCVCVSSNNRPENVDYDNIFASYPKQEVPYYACIVEGTQITLADRSTKAIEDITYDDELLVWNFYEGKFDSAKPCWITKPRIAHEYNLCKFSNGAETEFVGQGGDIGYHRIYNDEAKAFTHTGVAETPIGTHTFAEDGAFPELVSQEVITKPVRYYNIGTDKHINLFANGILTSSRISNKYAIEDMRYVGERLISEQEEKDYIEKKLELS